ncbi:MAG: hypothetical protein JXR59_11350 [Desulfuromonadaceae bacterium]|nr:hypothetical protein [Desulfuromonadaceae bacterium]
MSGRYGKLLFLLLGLALLTGCSGSFSFPDYHGFSLYYINACFQGERSVLPIDAVKIAESSRAIHHERNSQSPLENGSVQN